MLKNKYSAFGLITVILTASALGLFRYKTYVIKTQGNESLEDRNIISNVVSNTLSIKIIVLLDNTTTENTTTTSTSTTDTTSSTSYVWVFILLFLLCVCGAYAYNSNQNANRRRADSAARQREENEKEADIKNSMSANVSTSYSLGSGIIGWNGYELRLPNMNWPAPRDASKCVSCQDRTGKIRCAWCGEWVCNKCLIKLGIPNSTASKAFRIITGIGVEKYFPFCPRCRNFGKENNLF